MYSSKNYHQKYYGKTFGLVILSLFLGLFTSISGVTQAAGTVSGRVFRDYNADGIQNVTGGPADEPGVGGVTVTAYGAAGTAIASVPSTTPSGDYTISWLTADTRVRLEFSDLPGVAQQGAFARNQGSGTSIHFVDAGATNVNYGINRPGDYCYATQDLKVVTTCFERGSQLSDNNVVVSHAYDGTGSEATVAIARRVGTAWGLAYKRGPAGTAGTLFVSAFAKRQAEYGPGGRGAIYAIDMTPLPPPTPVQPYTVSLLATIPNAGTTNHNNTDYSVDSTFFAAPGEESLGDLDISEDGKTLYVVNLANKNLYSVDVATGAVAALGIIGNPSCTNGEYRPFGLGIRDGLVYVGGVCDASTEPVSATMSDSLQAYVFSYNPKPPFTVTQVLTFPLNYPRGCTDIDPAPPIGPVYGAPTPPHTCRTGKTGSNAEWQPWRDTWPNPNQTPPGTGMAPAGGDLFFAYPEPMLSGIEFDGEDMIVSFRDRMGDQIGYQDLGPDGFPVNPFPNNLIEVTAGDLLRASPNGAGGWTIESNGGSNPPGDFGPSAGNAHDDEGPGTGEFYFQDNFINNAGVEFHDETITGGILQIPGTGEITAVVMDPLAVFSAGTSWYSNGTGARNRTSFEIISSTAPFGKGNGLGDLAALCDSAPIEIGNYVWFDANKNGVQDPDETPIPGVDVELFDPASGLVIATATTDANGQYIFSSSPINANPGSSAFVYGLPIAENTNYIVRVLTTQPALVTFTTTIPTAIGTLATPTVRDSNGVFNPLTKYSVATVTTGLAGQNDHTLDFGFFVGVPILTPTPSTPPAPGTPSVGLTPNITKEVDPPFAQPGDQVRWTIGINNPHAVAIPNVSFVDNFPSELEVISATADTAGGTLTVTGNTVSYSIPTLNPGQTIKITVLTRIKLGTPVPFIITNTVNLTGAYVGSASATVLSAGTLPATGFEPPWRMPLLVAFGALLILFGFIIYRRRQRTTIS